MMLFVSYEEEQRKEGTNTNVGVECRVMRVVCVRESGVLVGWRLIMRSCIL